jgi:hypothetical protein
MLLILVMQDYSGVFKGEMPLGWACFFVSLRCFSHRSQPYPKTSKLQHLICCNRRRVKTVQASNDMHAPLLDHPDLPVDSWELFKISWKRKRWTSGNKKRH